MGATSLGLADLVGFTLPVNLFFSLFLAFVLLPAIFTAYTVLKWWRKCWIGLIKWRYPNYVAVEENSVRGILDHGRNHGIYTLLIQGHSIADGIRNHLARLTSTRKLLRSALTTRWGIYVWRELDYFLVDDHIIDSPCSFRGRPINELNIQDYISDVTSKFLPTGLSPWQVHVVHCCLRGKDQQICLVRVHHLLLKHEHLTLAAFLPINYSTDSWTLRDSDSPFTNLYAEPTALPRLRQQLAESFSNYWNDFLCNNDPIERPEITKKPIGIFQCLKIAIIVLVSATKEFMKQYRKPGGPKATDFYILQQEALKRNFGISEITNAIFRSLNPVDSFYFFLAWAWYLGLTISLKLPILMIRELRALKSNNKHFYPDTLVYFLWCYLPLTVDATLEFISIAWIAINAPRLIIDELFLKHSESHRLQTISPCGRKIVAWSEEVDLEIVKKISSVIDASEAEILLVATVDALKEYFRSSTMKVPEVVPTTAKFVSQRALFVQNHEARGILCLPLPTRTPFFEDDPLEILQVVQKNIREARSNQCAIYAITAAELSRGVISSFLPSLFLKLILNYLSKRYSLSLTHVDGDLPMEGVTAAMYWRPPQGNCNMSITLHRYKNGVRLGVMCDAIIGPQHSIITKSFPKCLENLANTVGVPRTPSRSPSPNLTSPTTSPGY